MSEPQPPYGPPPGYPVPGSSGAGAGPGDDGTPSWGGAASAPSWGGPSGPVGPPPGLDPSASGRAPLGPGWPQAPHTGPQETESKAVVALVLAVLAYTPVVPFVGAIAALVLARWAERDILASGGAKSGRGLVKAARVLAWLHLVFVALLVVAVVVLFLLPIGLSTAP